MNEDEAGMATWPRSWGLCVCTEMCGLDAEATPAWPEHGPGWLHSSAGRCLSQHPGAASGDGVRREGGISASHTWESSLERSRGQQGAGLSSREAREKAGASKAVQGGLCSHGFNAGARVVVGPGCVTCGRPCPWHLVPGGPLSQQPATSRAGRGVSRPWLDCGELSLPLLGNPDSHPCRWSPSYF